MIVYIGHFWHRVDTERGKQIFESSVGRKLPLGQGWVGYNNVKSSRTRNTNKSPVILAPPPEASAYSQSPVNLRLAAATTA